MNIKKVFSVSLSVALLSNMFLFLVPVSAAAFTEFSIRPSRVEVSIEDVNFLIKSNAVTTATESSVNVTFDTGYSVDATAANIEVSTTNISSWDSECINAWPGIGTFATGVSGNAVTFSSGDLTVGSTYCFIITSGIQNPSSVGNYSIDVATSDGSDVDTGSFTLPIVDDDEIVITAEVASFVRCDVTTTTGADNAIDLGVLGYGTVTSSTDDIQISGGTNATEGMEWYYRSDASNNGLYSATAIALIDGSSAEATISATTSDCTSSTPCFGIYYNGTTTAGSGSFIADADFTGGIVTTDVGILTTNIYGTKIGDTVSTVASQITADFNVNATAGENTPIANDYTETLIFTCKADL